MARRSRRRATKRFYLIMTAFISTVVLLCILLFKGDGSMLLVKDSMSKEITREVVIIRDETVYNATNYSATTFNVIEGETVTSGTTIAQIYKWGFNPKLLTDVITIEGQIRDLQENDLWGEVVNKDLNEINTLISAKVNEIAQVVQGKSSSDIVLLERTLRELFEQKQSFLNRNVQADARLADLYTQLESANLLLSNWREDVIAEEGGVVSFYLDGQESKLSPSTLEMLTREDVEAAKRGIVYGTSNDNATTKPLYRLVNNYKWYCVIIAENRDAIPEMRVNNEARVTFEGFYDRPYSAKITSIRRPEGGGILYILEMNEDITPLLNVRTANVTIKLDFEGLKIKKDLIFNKENNKVIKVQAEAGPVLVPVDVLIEDDEFAIIASLSEDFILDENTMVLSR